MPHVVNGIGTWYYGKSSRTTREATCPYCSRPTTLASYDTRLWFVVFYVPIIPLGKKRITDECIVCRKHNVAPLHKWKDALKTDVAGAFTAWQQQPSAETARKAFAALIGYRQIPEAAIFADEVCAKLPAEHELHARMAATLAGLGEHSRAGAIFERVNAAKPGLPEVSAGLASARIREGRLDEARTLLAHLDVPGAARTHSIEPLEQLGDAYQAAGRHVDALDIYSALLREVPKAADHDGFRKKVAASEKALGKRESILPKRGFSIRRLFSSFDPNAPIGAKRGFIVAAFLVVAVVAGLFLAGEYSKRHRKVYIVNSFEQPATVVIGDAGTFTASPGLTALELKEGKYRVKVSGAITEEYDADVSAKSFWGFEGDPVWVINVGGRAILLHTTATYRQKDPPPQDQRPVFGEQFSYFPNITHPFKELPSAVSVKRTAEKTLTALDIFEGEMFNVVAHLATSNRPNEALRACEWHLGTEPDDESVLSQYVDVAPAGSLPRVEKFLAAGLDKRPVNVAWHRAYQLAASAGSSHEEVVKRYDAMLEKEPGSSSLLYLRGRLCEDPKQATDYYTRAVAADSKDPWPSFELGTMAADMGEWKTAQEHLERAAVAAPERYDIRAYLMDARLGMKDYAALEKDFRAALEEDPVDFPAFTGLVETLVAMGKIPEAKVVASDFVKRIKKDEVGDELVYAAQGFAALATGDHEAVERLHTSRTGPDSGSGFFFLSLIAQNQLERAQKRASDPDEQLIVALAWHMRGDAKRFAEWREKAAVQLAEDPHTEDIAGLLRVNEPVAPAQVARLHWPTRQRSLLAAIFAASHPPGTELRELAGKLNIGVLEPAPLVNRFLNPAK